MASKFPERHRRSVRLKGYDYSQAGAYFVTICTQDHASLFGAVTDDEIRMNEAGEIARDEWFKAASLRPCVHLAGDEFIVMPNHVHGIVWIGDNVGNSVVGNVGAQRRCAPTAPAAAPATMTALVTISAPPTTTVPADIQSMNVVPGSLGAIVRAFKSATTRRINALRGTPGTPVWQRNYYEHVVRDEESLNRIRQYILDNPARWAFDRDNPQAKECEMEDAWVA